MNLIYDVQSTLLMWHTFAWTLFVGLVVWFFWFAVPYLSWMAEQSDVKRKQQRTIATICIAFTLILAWIVFDGFFARYRCLNTEKSEMQLTEGIVSSLKHYPRSEATYFWLGETHFEVRSGATNRNCGYTPSLAELVVLREGDALQIEHSGRRILRAWRRSPP